MKNKKLNHYLTLFGLFFGMVGFGAFLYYLDYREEFLRDKKFDSLTEVTIGKVDTIIYNQRISQFYDGNKVVLQFVEMSYSFKLNDYNYEGDESFENIIPYYGIIDEIIKLKENDSISIRFNIHDPEINMFNFKNK